VKKILVASEEGTLRRLVAACLRKRDFSISHLDNPKESIPTTRREKPDLIILDTDFGKRSGQSVFRDLQKSPERSSYKLLVISDALSADREIMLSEGAQDMLVRPFSPPSLRKCIDGLLEDENSRAASPDR